MKKFLKAVSAAIAAIAVITVFGTMAFAESSYYFSEDFEGQLPGSDPSAALTGGTVAKDGDGGNMYCNNLGAARGYYFIFTCDTSGSGITTQPFTEGTLYVRYRFKGRNLKNLSVISGIRASKADGTGSFRNAAIKLIEKDNKPGYSRYQNYRSTDNRITGFADDTWVNIGYAISLDKGGAYTAKCYFNGEYIGDSFSDKGTNCTVIDSVFGEIEGAGADSYYAIDDITVAYGDDVEDEAEFFKPEFYLVSSSIPDEAREVLPYDSVTLRFSAPVASFDGAFSINSEPITDVSVIDEAGCELLLSFPERLKEGADYLLETDPGLLIPKSAKPYSGAVQLSFGTGVFEKVKSKCRFYIINEEGGEEEIFSAAKGEVRTLAEVVSTKGAESAAVIQLICRGTPEFYNVESISTEYVSLDICEPKTVGFSGNISEDEFIKVLVWDTDENSLQNISDLQILY